ncbi:uncharacterized protein [Aristolochia californica]|uniref:uncharacterized protein isoform X2 n=1 Tax=Aristolochia californica TaxID=171875 RepID=UPI0035DA0899
MATKHAQWRLLGGQYLGEISALCFLSLPEHSSLPFLLAGTGSQILLYDIETGKILSSCKVFEGIRVHGISCSSLDSANSDSFTEHAFRVAVFGERRVKLFRLHLNLNKRQQIPTALLMLIESLPRFSHWVMDICFMEDGQCFEKNHLVVGLSNNSIWFWDICRSLLFTEVKNPERCLLYSMRFWGNSIKSLRVASGTIFNDIVTWKLVASELPTDLTSSAEKSGHSNTFSLNRDTLLGQQYKAVNMCRLKGHEGSIFHISWSMDGSKVISVSDDRSALIWHVNDQKEYSDCLKEVSATDVSADLVLFGHNARVWDCYISDSIIITVGEDCTCRMWNVDGTQLMVLKEHIGRGIWRCLYDPGSSILVTAGFDSAIKVHSIPVSLPAAINENGFVKQSKEEPEVFIICTLNLSEQLGPINSKSEYVRCLEFAREDILYVATNHGYIHLIKLYNPAEVKWSKLVRVSEEVPIICMDLLPMGTSDLSSDAEVQVAVGDGKGNATILKVISNACSVKEVHTFSWSAEKERQLLGIYWCKQLGCRYLFTANPGGRLKLWCISETTEGPKNFHVASLIAEFTSCFGSRIMCLDASFQEEVLVAGDQRGNLLLFPLSKDFQNATLVGSEKKIEAQTYFKGAHGISSVASISIAKSNFNEVEITSTGGDGCICHFAFHEDRCSLEFLGMKQVKELSLVQSVLANSSLEEDATLGNYAIGFASTDFIIWDLINGTKVLAVPCGGWRRPYTYYLGTATRTQKCFAYLKDQNVHVYRLWLPETSRRLPQLLHMQFHGREIHSLCFVFVGSLLYSNKDNYPSSKSSWIATGCEDGTIRLTRYASGTKSWLTSKFLGEHVGGSAVKSICFISKIYTSKNEQLNTLYHQHTEHHSEDSQDHQMLLISVGAKQVLTSWVLRKGGNQKEEKIVTVASQKPENIAFQWLSTHMPPKFSSSKKSSQRADIKQELGSKLVAWEHNENDWRYLAVTAFLVKSFNCRLTVCFVVVACSDATLTLRALLLPSRLWYDVASLVPQCSPVLALQHLVIPIDSPCKGWTHNGNKYLVVSGSTDGSITFWDLTETVEDFMLNMLIIEPDKFIDRQRRPRTGRGSQGGRWWRSLSSQSSEKGPIDSVVRLNSTEESEDINIQTDQVTHWASSVEHHPKIDPSAGICELWPLHVMNSVHQSGVNCLHISSIKVLKDMKSDLVFGVLSGGDDQAVSCLVFDWAPQQANPRLDLKEHITNQEGGVNGKCYFHGPDYMLNVLSQDRIDSAHSSAVKGIWTDGNWVFSTGLDQRVRCWHLSASGKLTEHAHLIVSVPEPETLDAQPCGRNNYQIAVGGRGMQMVEFFTPILEEC